MITVEKAKQLVIEHAPLLGEEKLSLKLSSQRILSQAVEAPFSLPHFRQSAMDGYAVRRHEKTTYVCTSEVPAGSAAMPSLKPGEAVRIFTGARVPKDADSVVMQEWVQSSGKAYPRSISLLPGKSVQAGANIRPVAEQIAEGDVALESGTPLNGAALGYLQSFGLDAVWVRKQPVIVLIITGDELVKKGESLKAGQIYESNALTLEASLTEKGFPVHQIIFVEDDLEATRTAIEKAVDVADLVLLSGGISVGDHDHVLNALRANSVEQLFYKVKQKPGKPLYFGKKQQCSLFGLPGNPASALTGLYHYVIPHLLQRSGSKRVWPQKLQLPIARDFQKKGDRSVFLKAQILDSEIHLMGAQASSMLSSFATADGLLYLRAEVQMLKAGQLAEIHLL